MQVNDQDIIALMQNEPSQEQGLRMLMAVYQSRLYWHIWRLVKDEDEAKDILQEVFIKVFQSFHHFKKESKLYTWLYRIATNEALQHLNKINKMKKTDDGATYYLQNNMTDEGILDKAQKLLSEAIELLSTKQKLVFTMRYYDELSYEEIAQILEMSVNTLKTNYHYAKQKIEQYIVEHSEEF